MDGEEPQRAISFSFEGQPVAATPGMTVAAALLAANITAFRQTAVSQTERGPFCMMGTCYDCVVSINGQTVQACMTPARDNLVVARVPIVTQAEAS